MKTTLNVENMQCAHCVNTINNTLLKINGVYGIEANIAAKQLVMDHTPEVDLNRVNAKLKEMGYPAIDTTDKFEDKASGWDQNARRVAMAESFVRRVMETIPILPETRLMDFGCGTGLVGLQFAPYVKSLVMVDNSPSMLEVLKKKVADLELNSEAIEFVSPGIGDMQTSAVDVIVSSMTFHHIEDTASLLGEMYAKLTTGGYIAIADLVKEDGSFHDEEVPHNGFDEHDLCELLSKTGFQFVLCETFNRIKKETRKGEKEFPQFLIIAKK
ncbi:MAG: methyltransferase domain-containing protein [Paludibacteraceae bacterium]|nr:methyltransferase domain-containing protein [Paludibacteraceae bacterium]